MKREVRARQEALDRTARPLAMAPTTRYGSTRARRTGPRHIVELFLGLTSASASHSAYHVLGMSSLSRDEVLRYSRHLVMPEVTLEGQLKLKNARVLCVGAGGLGSPLTLYLAAAGVGTIGVVDFDTVDLTNIQRQILYGTSDVGRLKLDAARERLSGLNPEIEIVPHAMRLTSGNVMDLFRGYDVIADGRGPPLGEPALGDRDVLVHRSRGVDASVGAGARSDARGSGATRRHPA